MALLDLDRHDGLGELAPERALVAGDGVLGQLLGDGGPALGDAPLLHVAAGRTGDRAGVDPAVEVEAGVLGGEDRVDQDPGHAREGDDLAVLLGVQVRKVAAVGGQDAAGLRRGRKGDVGGGAHLHEPRAPRQHDGQDHGEGG